MSTVLSTWLRTHLPNTIINPPQQSCCQTVLEQFRERAISERSCASFIQAALYAKWDSEMAVFVQLKRDSLK